MDLFSTIYARFSLIIHHCIGEVRESSPYNFISVLNQRNIPSIVCLGNIDDFQVQSVFSVWNGECFRVMFSPFHSNRIIILLRLSLLKMGKICFVNCCPANMLVISHVWRDNRSFRFIRCFILQFNSSSLRRIRTLTDEQIFSLLWLEDLTSRDEKNRKIFFSDVFPLTSNFIWSILRYNTFILTISNCISDNYSLH